MIKEYLDSQLATRRQELQAAETAMQIARQKVVDAEDHLTVQETRWRELQGRVQELEAVKAQVDASAVDDRPRRRRPATTGRGMSDAWRGILAMMKENRPNGAGYDDIVEFGRQVDLELNKTNLRRHMSIYVEKGYVERVGDGAFVLTPKGAGVALPPIPPQEESFTRHLLRELDEEIPF
ncbi:hypothetical protein FJ950_02745 [Mesorhizobium sp. B2-3-14]|uniref:hypothetical protein n=1 Tax=Mesorhizobium sp. B2-3-14 TaxID=2589950 RepID=UPI00112610C9|nr:hypothetical protein [Mesorhizobium sp. B2-3-14]TPL89289.1 hypothetical protein FJ950_02745 [Mesorhizobium sp. B2-3-14]